MSESVEGTTRAAPGVVRQEAPTFSVILTTFARQPYLDEAIQSVLNQTLDDFELIVVDDASPEPVVVPADPRIRLVRRAENGGPAAARNSGIDAATGEWVTFLDDDDEYDNRRLEMVAPLLDRAPMILCWFKYHGAAESGRTLNGSVGGEVLAGAMPHLGATTVRRDIAERFDESRPRGSDDVEWWVRMAHHPVATVPRVGYWMRKHSAERVGYGVTERIASSKRILETHAEFFAANRRAAAFRWKRIGLMSMELGDRPEATLALRRSMRLSPSIRTLAHLVRAARLPYERPRQVPKVSPPPD